MQIKTISYSQSKETIYGYGLKRWDKASVEISIDENEQPDKAFELAKQLVNEQLDITINQVEQENKSVQVDKPTPPTKTMIEEMEACTTFPDIQSFRFTVKNDAEKAVYEKKLLELSK